MSRQALDFWNRAVRAYQTAKMVSAADPDAAASRAYYAAFYAASAFFALRDQSFSKHSALAASIHRELVKEGIWSVELGQDYNYLLRLRKTADYGEAAQRVSSEQSEKAITAAGRLLQAVHEAHPEVFSESGER